MMGKTHKSIGVAVGAAFALHGLRHGDAAFTLALVSAPMAAMLPDIDHGGSRLGRMRKRAFNITVVVLGVVLILAAWLYGQYITHDFTTVLILGLVVVVPTVAIFYIAQTKWARKMLKFITKHRGIMHTLLIPCVGLLGVGFIEDRYFLILLYGFIFGYLSHILADCFTVNGCPILFPFTRKSIRFSKITTRNQSAMEKTVSTIMIAIILCIPALPVFWQVSQIAFAPANRVVEDFDGWTTDRIVLNQTDANELIITFHYVNNPIWAESSFVVLNAWIEDNNGLRIKTLYSPSGMTDFNRVPTGTLHYTWNLTNMYGYLVPMGEYTFFIEGGLYCGSQINYSHSFTL
ncbi:MAG: metal-dependent hydrolase [Defluviitaleaceae bacterium]|nr:metal-dependent hydrolase [Defluviitaleaceae bacterium]